METLHMTLGDNLGNVLLDIAQDNIRKGNFEKAFQTYTKSLPGFTREYVLDLLRNRYVLVTSEDHESMELVNNPDIISENKKNIYNWVYITENMFDNMHEEVVALWTCINDIAKLGADAYDYNLLESTADSGLKNIAAKLITNQKFSDRLSNGESLWDDLEENVYNEEADKEEQILFHLVRFTQLMRSLHKTYMNLSDVYKFLLDNTLITPSKLAENFFENALELLEKFSTPSLGYYHPLCNTKLREYKLEILEDISRTFYGKIYVNDGIIPKNILDKYDAGFLAPDGTFYGANGETNALLHVQLSDQLTKKKIQITGLDPEQALMKMGYLKIHHDDIYGWFKWYKDDSKEDSSGRELYCPTKEQIRAISSYIDTFYGGKFYTEPQTFGSRFNNTPITTTRLRAADEIQLHQMFSI